MFYELLLSKGGKPHFIKKYLKMISSFQFKPGEYVERHHILPKSFFPEYSKSSENIKILTGRQHYLVHICLSLAFPNTRMVYAVIAMRKGGRRNEDGINFNSHLYEKIRKKFSLQLSKDTKGIPKFVGEENPMYGRRGKDNPQYGYKRTPEQVKAITKGLMAMHERMSTDPEYKQQVLEQRRANTDMEQFSQRSRDAKLGTLNPNHGKDITNSFTPEQREKQKANARKGMLARMPWEKKTWSDDKDFYWSKADEFFEALKVHGRSFAMNKVYGRKDLTAFNATSSIIERFKSGWNPSECSKWLSRYKTVIQ